MDTSARRCQSESLVFQYLNLISVSIIERTKLSKMATSFASAKCDESLPNPDVPEFGRRTALKSLSSALLIAGGTSASDRLGVCRYARRRPGNPRIGRNARDSNWGSTSCSKGNGRRPERHSSSQTWRLRRLPMNPVPKSWSSRHFWLVRRGKSSRNSLSWSALQGWYQHGCWLSLTSPWSKSRVKDIPCERP